MKHTFIPPQRYPRHAYSSYQRCCMAHTAYTVVSRSYYLYGNMALMRHHARVARHSSTWTNGKHPSTVRKDIEGTISHWRVFRTVVASWKLLLIAGLKIWITMLDTAPMVVEESPEPCFAFFPPVFEYSAQTIEPLILGKHVTVPITYLYRLQYHVEARIQL